MADCIDPEVWNAMRRIQQLTVIGTVALAASLVPARVWAGAQEQAAAEALFQDARNLMQGGKFAEACPKLVDSNKLDPAVGTLLYLGECYEKNGQTASAWVTFQTAAEAGNKANQPERAKVASDRANALLPKLSKITITVAAAANVAGLEVKRDGIDVGKATWGVGVPVDPGEHSIVAKAPGKKDWSKNVRVEPDGATANVDIPTLEDVTAKPPEAASPNAQSLTTGAKLDDTAFTSNGISQRQWAHVAGGIGILGLAAGTVFGLEANSKENQSHKDCLPNAPTECNPAGVDLRHSGHTYATMANVAFGVGAAGLITGVILRFTAPSATPTSEKATTTSSWRRFVFTPVVTERSSSLLVTGAF